MSTSESAHSQAAPAETSHVSLSTEASDTTETSIRFVKAAVPWWMILLHNWIRQHLIVLVLGSSGFLVVPVAAKYFPHSTNSPQLPAQQQVVSQADYNYQLLKLRMTLTDAQATLGRAIEISRDETTATYKWVNSDGSAITAIFENDQLVSKKQLGRQ